MATGGLGNLEKLVERYKHAADAAEDLIQRLDAADAHLVLQAAQGQRTAVERHEQRRIQQLLDGIDQLNNDTLEILKYEDIIGSACDRFVERIDETKPPNYILAAFVWAGLVGVVGAMFGNATGRLVDAILAIF